MRRGAVVRAVEVEPLGLFQTDMPFAGVPASLGPGLRTVNGAVRSLGEKL